MQLISHLTEKNLGDFLEATLPCKIDRQYQIIGMHRRMRVDYRFVIDGVEHFVEFDGYRHYTDFATQIRDDELKEYCTNNNVQLIQIPYFIQLRPNYLDYVFGETLSEIMDAANFECTYLHGFRSPVCKLPWDFNHMGLSRFLREATSTTGIFKSTCNAYSDNDIDVWSVGREIQDSLWSRRDAMLYSMIYSDFPITSNEYLLAKFLTHEFT